MIFMIRFYTIRQREVQEVLLSQPKSWRIVATACNSKSSEAFSVLLAMMAAEPRSQVRSECFCR